MLYILYGENTFELDKFIDSLMKEKSITEKIVYDYEECDINECIDEASYNDLFGNLKLVVLNNSTFLTSKSSLENERFNNYITSPNPNTYLVFTVNSDKLDERKKLVKELKSKSIVKEFKSIDKTNIDTAIKDYFNNIDYKINMDAVSEIKSRLLTNTSVLYSELSKLEMYKYNSKEITLEDVKKVIIKYEEDNIFKLVDAVINKDKKRIFTIYKKIINDKVEPSVIIVLLANNIRLILQTKLLYEEKMSETSIASKLKEHPYRIKLALNNAYKSTINELVSELNKLFYLDYKIKTGEVDRYKGLEAFFIEL